MLSKAQTIFLSISIILAFTIWGALISLAPPFYPSEAEKKGATPSQVWLLIQKMITFTKIIILGRKVRRLNNRSDYLSKLVWVCIRYIQSGCVCFLSRIWSIWDKDRGQKIIHLGSHSYSNKCNGVWFSRVYPRYRYFSWTFLLSEVSYRTRIYSIM